MDEVVQYAAYLEQIARKVQEGFIDMRNRIKSGRLSQDHKTAINSLPHDAITWEAKNRLAKFPNDCCMDASHVLAIIFIAFAEQQGLEYGQLQHIRAIPTDKTKMKMFDFHQWLRVDGFDVDITFGQLKTAQKGNEGKIVFPLHPLINSDDYVYTGAPANIDEPFAIFANFIIANYFRKGG
ncbi:MAG: hypothetical protein FWF81_12895 [Defluviitaleaceae bacterium]|nr:hypothetical protein [Defluviitaleaceae bacterium]